MPCAPQRWRLPPWRSLAGCGGDDKPAKDALAWFDTPRVIVPTTLKQDRILQAEVRNDSDQKVRVERHGLRVYDDRGRPVKASATFAEGYLHSLYPPTRGPANLPDSELERLGKLAEIEPGKTATLTVSWREPAARRTAATIDYGQGSLAIPPESVRARRARALAAQRRLSSRSSSSTIRPAWARRAMLVVSTAGFHSTAICRGSRRPRRDVP